MAIVSRSLCGLLVLISTATAATQDHIGGWVLACSGQSACRLRAEKRFVDKAGITAELEILADGPSLVPVLALRGLSTEALMTAATMGSVDAWMQLDGGPRETLDCAPAFDGYFCTPRGRAARALAAELPTARTVTMRTQARVTGMTPLPAQQTSLALTGTRQALIRLRAAGTQPVPDANFAAATRLLPQASSGTIAALADKALRAAGYPNGVGDLSGLVAKYLKK
ncbi:MAG TPA: hypothetical protein VHX39_17145 [Acetobacteraceae bacterium]|nr:hypothetical protein [Acetobacteraceae bacterium]